MDFSIGPSISSSVKGSYFTEADIVAFDLIGHAIKPVGLLPQADPPENLDPVTDEQVDPRQGNTFDWDSGTFGTTFTLLIRDPSIDPSLPEHLVYREDGITATQSTVPAETLDANTEYTWQVVAVRPLGFAYSGIVPFATICPADMNGDGILDQGDIQTFQTAFLIQDESADFNSDGVVDNGDIGLFIEAFLAGC